MPVSPFSAVHFSSFLFIFLSLEIHIPIWLYLLCLYMTWLYAAVSSARTRQLLTPLVSLCIWISTRILSSEENLMGQCPGGCEKFWPVLREYTGWKENKGWPANYKWNHIFCADRVCWRLVVTGSGGDNFQFVTAVLLSCFLLFCGSAE